MRADFFRSLVARRSARSTSASRSRRPRLFETLEPRLAMTAIQDWSIRGVGGGGALFSPSFNPTNANEIFIASDMGQVFHTTNEGAAWETVDHRELHGSHHSKVQFTTNPQILYAVDYTADVVRATKSVDAGATWTPLSAAPTSDDVLTLVADYNNPNCVLVSDYNRLFISTDGGATFTQRFSTAAGAGLHVGGAFFDGSNIYVGTNQGVLVSSDGGTSFSIASYTGIPTGQAIVGFAGAKENGTTRFWAVAWAAGDVFAGVQGFHDNGYAGLYRIDVGQSVWTPITTGVASGARPFLASAAINDIDTVYVAGGSTAGTPTVFRSTDGGTNWQSVLQTTNNANVQTGWSGHGGDRSWGYGETAMGFTVSPLDSSRAIITDFGFAHLTEDGGGSWRALYVTPDDLNSAGAPTPQKQPHTSSGLENTTSWGLTWTNATHIIGSFSDIRGAVSHDAGDSWSFNYTGHTQNSMYRSVVQPTTGIVYAAATSVHDMYQSTHLTDAIIDATSVTGSVLFSTNGGDTWQTMHNFGNVVTWVEIDPSNPNRVYASVAHSTEGGIYVTNNASAGTSSTWTKLANPPRTQGHAFNIRVLTDGTLVVSYSGRRDAGGNFTASSGVFVSTDGGTSWQDRSHTGMHYWTKDVVIDPYDTTQNTWYAAVFSGWGGPPNGLGGLYKTINRGTSWTRINALDRVNSITISPNNSNEAYLTTEVEGLWYTENLNAGSPTFAQVAGYKFMHPMRVQYNPFDTSEVWVTSFGGGLRVGHTGAPVVNQWKGPAGGSWADPNNWTGGVVPDGDSGEVGIVRLWNNLAADGIVNIGSISRTLRLLSLEDTNASYTVDSTGGSLIVRSTSGDAQIVFTPGNTQNHAISAALQLGSNTQIDAAQETLTLSGILNWNNKSMTVVAGTVQFDSAALGQNTTGAQLTINPGATVVLAGTGSLSDGNGSTAHYVDVVNNGTLTITPAGGASAQSSSSAAIEPAASPSLVDMTQESAPVVLPTRSAAAQQPLAKDLLMMDDLWRRFRDLRNGILWPTVSRTRSTAAPVTSDARATIASAISRMIVEADHLRDRLPGKQARQQAVDAVGADEVFQWYGAKLDVDE